MVANKNVPYPDQELFDYVVKELDKRGIDEWTVGNAAYAMQHQYYPDVTVEQFGSELTNVLKKREVLNNLAVGFALDDLANRSLLPEPLQTIVANDLGAFGVDEALALSITQLYGTVSSTNYGHADKEKIGFAKELDNSNGEINTFSDDLFSALASAVCARFAHGSALQLDESADQSERIDDHIESLKSDLKTSVDKVADQSKCINDCIESLKADLKTSAEKIAKMADTADTNTDAKTSTTSIVDEMKKAIKGIPNSCDQTNQTNLDVEPKNLHGWTYTLKRKDDGEVGEDLQETDSQSVSDETSSVERDGYNFTVKFTCDNDEPIDWDEMPSLDKTTIWQEVIDKVKQRTYEAIDRELSTKPMLVHPFGDLNSVFKVTTVSPENETPNHKYIIASEISLFDDLFGTYGAIYCLTYEELYDAMNDLYNAYPDDYKDIRKLIHDAIEFVIADFEDDEE